MAQPHTASPKKPLPPSKPDYVLTEGTLLPPRTPSGLRDRELARERERAKAAKELEERRDDDRHRQ